MNDDGATLQTSDNFHEKGGLMPSDAVVTVQLSTRNIQRFLDNGSLDYYLV